MAKKKHVGKEKGKKKSKETKAPEAVDNITIADLSPDTISEILKIQDTPRLFVDTLNNRLKLQDTTSLFVDTLNNRLKLQEPSSLSMDILSLEQDLEDKINDLRKDNRKLAQQITEKSEAAERKEIKIGELRKIIRQLQKNEQDIYKEQRLQYLLYRVNENARRKLLESEEFRNRFEKSEQCNAVVMSVDIRRSTELMLKARKPDLYADFITSLCTELTRRILDNYGVFDKFTGDGILAFFPDFYSGDDASYLAIRAAGECHNYFAKHYEANRSCFSSVLSEVGLGIGIDYGLVHLVRLRDGLTVIGTPVVYACRMSGAKAGQTLLNQPAYEVTSQKFGEYVNFQETEIEIKNEGSTLAYLATLSKKIPKIKPPVWPEASGTPES